MSNTRETNTIKTQFGFSSSADFEDDTWTFKMNGEYKVVVGEFALVDKILYDQLILSNKDLASHCEELKMQSIYLSNTVLAECSINVFLDYEIRSSSWAHYIGIEWMQEISSKYFAWKVRRKYARYLRSKMWEQRI